MTRKTGSKLIMRNYILALFGAVMLSCSMAALAQWKWVDSSGRTHYSDKPPPSSIPSQNILSAPAGYNRQLGTQSTAVTNPKPAEENTSTPAGGTSTNSALERERARLAQEEEAARQEQQRQDDAKRQQACEAANHRIELYTAGGRVQDIDSKGERYYLDEKELARRLTDAKRAQQEYCTTK